MHALTFLASLALVMAIPADVMNGFYPGRSGDAIVKPLNDEAKSGLAIFVDSSERYFRKLGSGSSASSQELGNVISRALGVQPLNEEAPAITFAADLVHSNLLDMPKGNLFIALNGLEAEMLNDFRLNNLQALRRTSSASLNFPSYPKDSIAEATSISTGKLPKEHGIVGSSWTQAGEAVPAFLEASSFSHTATAADILAQTFQGQSLIISASSDVQHTLAYCTNFELLQNNPGWNTFCLALNPSTSTYECVEPIHSYSKMVAEQNLFFSKETLISTLSDSTTSVLTAASQHGTPAELVGQTVNVHYPAGTASFDLRSPEAFQLFAELQYAFSLPAVIARDSVLKNLVLDDVPDYFALSFASLASLGLKYGTDSNTFVATAHLIDSLLPSIMGHFQTLYPDRLVSEVVLPVSRSRSANNAQDGVSQAINTLATFSQTSKASIKETFPQLQDVKQIGEGLCSQLSQKLQHVGFEAFCPVEAMGHVQSVSAFAYGTDLGGPEYPYPGNNSNPTEEEIALFQISLWTSLGLIAAVLSAVCCLCNMEYKKDPLIYGSFNPDWNSRKRR